MPPVAAKNIKDWIKHSQSVWSEQAKVAAEGGDEYGGVPDGRYVSRLTGAELNESQSSGRVQAHFVFAIIEGEEEGAQQHSYQGLENEVGLRFLARDLARLGYDPTTIKLSKIPDVLAELAEAKPVVRIRVRTTKKDGNEYQNTYIDRVLHDYEAEESEEEEADEDAEEEEETEADEEESEDEDEDEESEEETDDEESEEEEDENTAQVGMRVAFTSKKGKELEGVIAAIDEEEETLDIKSDDGKMHKGISAVDVEILDADETDEEEEEEEEPTPPPAKKGKAAPAAPPAKQTAAAGKSATGKKR